MTFPNPNIVQPGPVPQEAHMVQELSIPIHQAQGWLKFLGVLSIIGGVAQALSLVGIVIAWLALRSGLQASLVIDMHSCVPSAT
jgi:hypothetical protein